MLCRCGQCPTPEGVASESEGNRTTWDTLSPLFKVSLVANTGSKGLTRALHLKAVCSRPRPSRRFEDSDPVLLEDVGEMPSDGLPRESGVLCELPLREARRDAPGLLGDLRDSEQDAPPAE